MTIESQIEKTIREEHGRVLVALISQPGDLMLAGDHFPRDNVLLYTPRTDEK